MALNVLLLYLIYHKPIERMKNYRRLLVHGTLTNFVFCFFCFFVSPLIVIFEGGTYEYFNNPLKDILPLRVQTILQVGWMFMYISIASSLPGQFIYRYRLVCQKKIMSNKSYLISHVIALILNIPYCVTVVLSDIYVNENNISRFIPRIPSPAGCVLIQVG